MTGAWVKACVEEAGSTYARKPYWRQDCQRIGTDLLKGMVPSHCRQAKQPQPAAGLVSMMTTP